jgi:uncharacterized tellurite resistance protein B-like protein
MTEEPASGIMYPVIALVFMLVPFFLIKSAVANDEKKEQNDEEKEQVDKVQSPVKREVPKISEEPKQNNLADMEHENPIKEAYADITDEQKMSIINFLLAVATSDGDLGDIKKELKFINQYVDWFRISSERCTQYLNTNGTKQTIEDINELSHSQKELLVVAVMELVACDGRPNSKEINATTMLLKKIGIDEDEFERIIETAVAFRKYFS